MYAVVEDNKSISHTGKPLQRKGGQLLPTFYPGRKVTTKELNAFLANRFPSGVSFIRASYVQFENHFKFRFLEQIKIPKQKKS